MAVGIGIVTACAVYLILRGRTFSMVLGLSMLSTAGNLFIFSMGRLQPGASPIVAASAENYADPVPQALVLTAIVIGFGMTGFIMALVIRIRHQTGSDHVDGREPMPERRPEHGP
ncbi:MAG: Na+/H+ antiporter subunit C [Nitrospira sp.]